MKSTLFRWASYMMILMAFAHFAQIYNGISIPNSSPESIQMLKLMKTYEIELGMGVTKTMWQLVNGFILCWGLFVIVIGTINLWVLRYSPYNNILITRLAITNLLGLLASILISILFFSYPVIIFSSSIALLYFGSAVSPTTRV